MVRCLIRSESDVEFRALGFRSEAKITQSPRRDVKITADQNASPFRHRW